MLTKTLPGYGEIFRMLSYDDIGPAAMLSRAIGGVIGQVIVLTMPGSPAAVRLAMEKLIVPGAWASRLRSAEIAASTVDSGAAIMLSPRHLSTLSSHLLAFCQFG